MWYWNSLWEKIWGFICGFTFRIPQCRAFLCSSSIMWKLGITFFSPGLYIYSLNVSLRIWHDLDGSAFKKKTTRFLGPNATCESGCRQSALWWREWANEWLKLIKAQCKLSHSVLSDWKYHKAISQRTDSRGGVVISLKSGSYYIFTRAIREEP